MGLGLLGRGVGDAAFLASSGADLIITDLKTAEQLKASVQKLAKYKNIRYTLGEHKLEDFQNRDMILKSAGVPLDSIYIAEARKNNIPVEMSASLFAKLSGVPVIGITGTRGKSTVTYMIEHILKVAGKKVLLGGNVRGVSTLALLKKMKTIDFAVFELDSWQLQGFGEAKISPQISVFTTFYPDHLNYYGSTTLTTSKILERYFADKANIFINQKKEDYLVVGKQAWPFVQKFKSEIKSKIICPKSVLPPGLSLNIPGAHNAYNAMLAVTVARYLKISDLTIKKALKSFESVEGRLQFLRNFRGIKIYNDTNATTPEALAVALKSLQASLKNKGRLITISGGADKKLDNNLAAEYIIKYADYAFLLAGSGTDSIKEKILNRFKYKSSVCATLKIALSKAISVAKKGDIIVLSPGFASFGMFKNEYDRGDQFMKLIKNLK